MKVTSKDIETACEELKQALLATIAIDEKEEQVKLLKIKAHDRLLRAREEIRNLKTI